MSIRGGEEGKGVFASKKSFHIGVILDLHCGETDDTSLLEFIGVSIDVEVRAAQRKPPPLPFVFAGIRKNQEVTLLDGRVTAPHDLGLTYQFHGFRIYLDGSRGR